MLLKQTLRSRFTPSRAYRADPVSRGGGGGHLGIFGWVCAARDSKLAPRSKKIYPKIDTWF